MTWPVPTLADVLRARAAIAPHLRPTPVLEPPALAEALGCRVVLKCENLAPTGAFKVRGGLNLIGSMPAAERARGVLAVSTGNHAQSVAHAARIFGVRALICMPEAANPVKLAATRALGAEVRLVGRDFDEARLAAEEIAGREGLRYIHSANEPMLVAGVATWALELFEAVPDLDVLFVPVGAGSGALGAGLVARAVNPSARVVGVQAEGAPSFSRSFAAGRVVETEPARTFAEGLAVRTTFDLPMAWMHRFIDEVLLVGDDELSRAIRLLVATARQVVEPAGAAGLAGAVRRKADLSGRTVGIVLSGGNIPFDLLARILAEPDPAPPA